MRKNHKKGQYFSFDAIVASIIFTLTFISFVNYWFGVKSMLESKDEELTKQAMRISDYMISPFSFAISQEDKRINKTSLTDLQAKNLALNELKHRFNCPYNMFINVTESSGTFVANFGIPAPSKTRNIAKVSRIVVLVDGDRETLATFEIYLY